MKRLEERLGKIDGRGYKSYKELRAEYRFPFFRLAVDHVQGDPFATPSKVRILLEGTSAHFPQECLTPKIRRIGLEDFLARVASKAIDRHVKGNRGTGKSGLISIQRCAQEVLERTAVRVTDGLVDVRLRLGLPAAGRRVLAGQAKTMFFAEIPKIAESLLFANLDAASLEEHLNAVEDQHFLRDWLKEKKLTAFIGDGSILPRESGISDRPLNQQQAVPFKTPPSLGATVTLPHRGSATGMGIPEGITLVVGGGYHGKSTLLRAVEKGVYNHVPGDGRELCAARSDAVKIRSEDGRRVEKVDISAFINNLPGGQDTGLFSTENASGSTSQAANILEALEVGTSLLLIDEDTSATNFMIRDERMQELVVKEKEPITPFVDKAGQLYEERGTSALIVLGGSGDYFDVADTVIAMDDYLPKDVTAEAKKIAQKHQTGRRIEGGSRFGRVSTRVPEPNCFNPKRRKRTRVGGRGRDQIEFGSERTDLAMVEQLIDPGQAEAIARTILYCLEHRILNGENTLGEILEVLSGRILAGGLDILGSGPGHPGEMSLPRAHEIAAAINRLRTLRVREP